jgi:integrase
MDREKKTRASNGRSSIYQGADGHWHGRVTVGVKDDGTPDRRHTMSKDRQKVTTKVKEWERQRDAGKVRKPGRAWTVERWLEHWVENIAASTVRRTTMVGYRSSIYNHLIPGVGAHRLDKLRPEHLEALYALLQKPQNQGGKGLKAATVHLAHRTLRAALNEAVRRRHLVENPARIAKPPRVEEEEIVPFTVEEARRILTAAEHVRNGARYVIALTLGLRRGEALGLHWSDIDIQWRHGCGKNDECRAGLASECPARQLHQATMTVRRAVQQFVWQHGCAGNKLCGRKYAASCPNRHSGGVVTTDVKSRAGRRTVGMPLQLAEALERHRERQAAERERAADLWREEGWVFTNRLGGPVHPTVDYECWKNLLKKAQVRPARLHDARHTAATMLLVLKVPLPAVMQIMGWSDASIANRYMHVPIEFLAAIADQVSGLVWADPTDDDDQDDGHSVAPVPA